jgi:hypothetical protein
LRQAIELAAFFAWEERVALPCGGPGPRDRSARGGGNVGDIPWDVRRWVAPARWSSVRRRVLAVPR